MKEALKKISDIDPSVTANALQFIASGPDSNIWVGASAGSGKTKVLTERVLRLLLPDAKRKGANPASILCITFTKAAASEVLERIMRYLRDWAIIPDQKLDEELEKLLGSPPTRQQHEAARALFARILEVPGGMKIMTIHAFCQSVLARFPMEAGLPPSFEVMDEAESKALMTSIRHSIIKDIHASTATTELKNAFSKLATLKNAAELEKLLSSMANERGRLETLRRSYGTQEKILAALAGLLSVDPCVDDLKLQAQFESHIPAAALKTVIPLLEADVKTNIGHAKKLSDYLAGYGSLDDYRSVFLTEAGPPRKACGIVCKNDDIQKLFADEAERLIALDSKLRNYETYASTSALLVFSYAALDAYENEKHIRNRLDYEDLIEKTKTLLSSDGIHWVHYKLDGGIDHILVDEAQDTNPSQWAIITALYDEFYDGTSSREPLKRTTFVVGDEKQSIYSFQRADPAVFETMRTRLEEKASHAQEKFENVPMRISFRSSPAILRFVDSVFSNTEMQHGVTRDGMNHTAFHSGKGGMVEIWPLFEAPERKKKDAWSLPQETVSAGNPVYELSEKIALTIRRMLDDPQEKLISQDRPVRAGDIMILLSKRKPFADAILKALRKYAIPVNGIDRMLLMKQLAVLDILAALEFILLPDDDLNLATLLKSPLIGWDDERLYPYAHKRKTTLWQALRDDARCEETVRWLSGLLSNEGNVSKILHGILYLPCPADAQSGIKAMMARLGHDIADPLHELLARADRYDMTDNRGLQGFVHDARNDETDLKRQIDEGGDTVRLMTVHGSKGLEAPIVFLPDTIKSTGTGAQGETVLWPPAASGNNDGLPLWAPNAASRADIYKKRIADRREREDEEYKRLLYVALTRAAERLYIGGANKYAKNKADRVSSWYDRCVSPFANGLLDNVEEVGDGSLRIKSPQTDPIKRKEKDIDNPDIPVEKPDWLFRAGPKPDKPPKPLTPSKPENDEPAALSPLYGDTAWRFQRGKLIHTLFQFLPDIPEHHRAKKASDWLAKPAHGLKKDTQDEILASVMRVLEDPSFAAVFSPSARAEVPLTGLLHTDRIVSGQLDRLLVTNEAVKIIDFKTNRPAPKSKSDIPEAYKSQMRTYRDLLGAIWPDRPIHCALLWTDGPDLMDITDTL